MGGRGGSSGGGGGNLKSGLTVTAWHPRYGDVRGNVARVDKKAGSFHMTGGRVVTGNQKGELVSGRATFSISNIRK